MRNLALTDDGSAPKVPAIVYAARSKAEEENKHSTDDQIRVVTERIGREEGRFIVGSPFVDHKSGSRSNRGPDLAAAIALAIEMVREYGYAELWASKSERFGRGSGGLGQARALGALYYELKAQGIALRTVEDDGYVTDEAFVGMASKMASKYAEDLSIVTKRGKRAAYEDGWPSSAPPDGYETLTNAKGERTGYRFTARIEVIREIGALADRGLGYGEIVRDLNGRGIYCPSGRVWEWRDVKKVLSDRFYAGCAVWHRGKPDEEWHPDGKQPKVWDLATFDRRLATRSPRDRATERPKGRKTENHALGNDLARCRRCGEVMRPITRPYIRADGTKARTYVCRHVQRSTGMCDAPPIDAGIVDSAIIARLQEYIGDFDRWRQAIEDEQAGQRERLAREVAKAEDARAEETTVTSRMESEHARYVKEGKLDRADVMLGLIMSRRDDLARADRRLQAARDALAAVPDAAPADEMLDFYNGLSAAVRGRLDEAGDAMKRVHEALSDIFTAFVLDTVDEGVTIVPLLGWIPNEKSGTVPASGSLWATDITEITPPLREIRTDAKSGATGVPGLTDSGVSIPM